MSHSASHKHQVESTAQPVVLPDEPDGANFAVRAFVCS
jgi:hypothetical protein